MGPINRATQAIPTGRYWLRLAAFAIVMLGLAFSLVLAYLIHLQLALLVTPVRDENVGTPAGVGSGYQEITLSTSDDLTLSGWYIPGTRAEGIILVHGINANRRAMLPEAAILARAGYHLLLFDLRGHGLSKGQQITYGYREALDVQAAADYLASRPQVTRIGAVGTSLGGAAVVRAAAIDPRLEAIVIQSSFSSLPAAIEDAFDDFTPFPRWPFAPLIVKLVEQRVGVKAEQVDSARDLATLSPRPVLIIHSPSDALFPVEHARRMYQAAGEPRELWLIDNLGHANPALNREEEYKKRVVGFFERAFGRQS